MLPAVDACRAPPPGPTRRQDAMNTAMHPGQAARRRSERLPASARAAARPYGPGARLLGALVLAGAATGCAIVTVADAAVSVAATAVSVTAKAVGAVADVVIPDGDSRKKD